jgi:voltage-dependent potassium channel beta subunit
MEYRRLGHAGIKVSALSLGTWLTFAEQGDSSAAIALLSAARDAGLNLFDTAEAYGNGAAEALLGRSIERLGWGRSTYLLSSKLFWGLDDTVNMHRTLNRKYLMHSIDGCLDRLRTTFVDIIYCHRACPDTSIEEIVWTMSDLIGAGKAHYWGTSGWAKTSIVEAIEFAERYRLRKPVVEQPEYNLLRHKLVDEAYGPLACKYGLGLCTWSPLASGVLTGKYIHGPIPIGSRGTVPQFEWLSKELIDRESNRLVLALSSLARSFDCSVAQFAIAWCMKNPAVSSVILGCRTAQQLHHNLGALKVATKINEQCLVKISAILSEAARH